MADDFEEKLKYIIDQANKTNRLITGQEKIPIGKEGAYLNAGLPNYEDPQIKLTIPPKDAFTPRFVFSLGIDLNWHDPIKKWCSDQWQRITKK